MWLECPGLFIHLSRLVLEAVALPTRVGARLIEEMSHLWLQKVKNSNFNQLRLTAGMNDN